MQRTTWRADIDEPAPPTDPAAAASPAAAAKKRWWQGSSNYQSDGAVETACCLAEVATLDSGCFVATAALAPANPDIHPDLVALRAFRDQVLWRTRPGRTVVTLYYRWGRHPARFIRHRPIARWLVRTLVVCPAARIARAWLR